MSRARLLERDGVESQRKELNSLESPRSPLLQEHQLVKGPREEREKAELGGATKKGRASGHHAGLAGRGHARSPGKDAWSRGCPFCHRGLRHPLPGAHLPRRPRGSRWGRTRASLGTLGSFPIAFCASGNPAPASTQLEVGGGGWDIEGGFPVLGGQPIETGRSPDTGDNRNKLMVMWVVRFRRWVPRTHAQPRGVGVK